MDSLSYVPYILNGGTALVVFFLMITKHLVPGWIYKDKVDESEELKRALEHERDRSDAAMAAANATKDVLLSLRGRFSDDYQEGGHALTKSAS